MRFEELKGFKKDLKRLKKKHRTLPEDIEILKKVLKTKPDARSPFSERVSNIKTETCIIKVRRIACKSLPGKGSNTGLRIVYAYYPSTDYTEGRIVFIELYRKSDKAVEDRERIIKNFK